LQREGGGIFKKETTTLLFLLMALTFSLFSISLSPSQLPLPLVVGKDFWLGWISRDATLNPKNKNKIKKLSIHFQKGIEEKERKKRSSLKWNQKIFSFFNTAEERK
jgi:hypothetical protein